MHVNKTLMIAEKILKKINKENIKENKFLIQHRMQSSSTKGKKIRYVPPVYEAF